MKSVMPKWAKIKQMYTQKLDCIQIQHNTMSWTKQQYNIYDTYQWFFHSNDGGDDEIGDDDGFS